jgi:alkane 1-monooxygenase
MTGSSSVVSRKASSSSSSSSSSSTNGMGTRSVTRRKEFTLDDDTGEYIDFEDWRNVAPYYTIYVLFLSWALGVYYGNNWFLFWVVFAVIPIADILAPWDLANPREGDREKYEEMFAYKLPLYLQVPASALAMYGTVHLLCMDPTDALQQYGIAGLDRTIQRVGLVISCGLVTGGAGIMIAHELTHKLNLFERLMGHSLLAMVNYGHFALEHVSGHHKNVATEHDPATSHLNESLYQFYPRTLIGSFNSAWSIECKRLRGKKLSKWSHHNIMLRYAAASISIAAALMYCNHGNPMAIVYFVLQGWFAHMLLEVVNYIEHYGLMRKKTDGTYEPVNPTHSWNAPHSISNYLLFKLQRHSDHHANSLRRYHMLRNFKESPQMPTGYAGMLLLAMVPPLWFRVMNPMVEEYAQSEDKLQAASSTKVLPRTVELFSWFTASLVTLCVFVAPRVL